MLANIELCYMVLSGVTKLVLDILFVVKGFCLFYIENSNKKHTQKGDQICTVVLNLNAKY